ncbi:hypothetical protein PG1C_10025 [Rugosibacter aromaticivorans]|uniref:Lipoprotein n=1 Tax=Rugosibacter aromaticivorans TaxID=1565605 RepID=A0A0C5JAH5_9PROT|nr:hypothetical protein [Rugosibacter aromaticivorans]AJP48684.1 hypothetical protein PG1C_10025 [Rugosibacter aromaticivorans]
MKKILVVGLISSFLSAGAFAAACTTGGGAQAAVSGATAPSGEQCVCNGGAAIKSTVQGGSGTVIGGTVITTAPIFLKTGFDVQCSANTLVSYNEVSGTAFAVASGSMKGNQTFIGSSNGGAVTTSAKCTGTNDACTAANVTTANGLATTAAGS